MSDEQLMRNPSRSRIHDYLLALDGHGEALTEIARSTGLSINNTLYHLRVLEDNGLVNKMIEDGRPVYSAIR